MSESDVAILPRWIWGYAAFHVLLELGMGLFLFVQPQVMFGELAQTAAYPVGLYAVRSVAVGAAMALALLRRQPAELRTLFIVRLLTDVLDMGLVLFGSQAVPGLSELPPAAVALLYTSLFFVPELLCIRALWPRPLARAA